ncbi:MAG: DMT family transporter [Oscillospiraceae bacterium]|nr:DMT family transporter [Oscillospiraceae bacterium]
MKNKTHFFVSRKNVLTWLMVVCMVCSAVTRILFNGGAEGANLWSQIVLPIAAAVLFALICLISGKERFYKSAIPVWMISIYYCFVFSAHDFGNYQKMIVVLYCLLMAFIAIIYTLTTSGRYPATWVLVPLLALPVAAQWYLGRNWTPILPDALMVLGVLCVILSLHVHADGTYHPTWGDRNDGRRVRTLAPMAQITSYFQVERNTCSNLFEESFEISHMERYIRQKRREGLTDFGYTHVFLAAYVRALCKYPQLNRFISGQKVYSRMEDIQYCMVIKKEMTVEAPDTSIKVHLNRRNTAKEVYEKLNAAVEGVKATKELDSGIDNLIAYLLLIPGVIMKFVVWLLKLLDYFGLLPKFLTELSPFHGSLFFTSMGSLGIPPIYHHLYDFGNIPAFGAFGCKRRAYELQEDGTVVQRKYIDMKFVLDERIADGYYYAAFFKHYRNILRHPEILDLPPEEIIQDID